MSNNRNTYSSSRHNYGWWDIAELISDFIPEKPKCRGHEVGNEPGDGNREYSGVNTFDCTDLYPEKSEHRTKEGAKEWCAQHWENPWGGDAKQCKAAATPKSTTGCNIFPEGSFPAIWPQWVEGDCYYCDNDKNAHCDPS